MLRPSTQHSVPVGSKVEEGSRKKFRSNAVGLDDKLPVLDKQARHSNKLYCYLQNSDVVRGEISVHRKNHFSLKSRKFLVQKKIQLNISWIYSHKTVVI